MMPGPTFFFVLNGLVNGEEGMLATRAGPPDGPLVPDGWYFHFDDEWQDPDGTGPYTSRDEAVRAADASLLEPLATAGRERQNTGEVGA